MNFCFSLQGNFATDVLHCFMSQNNFVLQKFLSWNWLISIMKFVRVLQTLTTCSVLMVFFVTSHSEVLLNCEILFFTSLRKEIYERITMKHSYFDSGLHMNMQQYYFEYNVWRMQNADLEIRSLNMTKILVYLLFSILFLTL